MSIRKPRRAVMAELLLLADPAEIGARQDGMSLAVEFDSIAELRSWLDLAGLNTPDLLTHEHTGVDSAGQPYQAMNAWPTWHGWDIYAHARDYTAVPALDPQTTDRLAALVVAG